MPPRPKRLLKERSRDRCCEAVENSADGLGAIYVFVDNAVSFTRSKRRFLKNTKRVAWSRQGHLGGWGRWRWGAGKMLGHPAACSRRPAAGNCVMRMGLSNSSRCRVPRTEARPTCASALYPGHRAATRHRGLQSLPPNLSSYH